MQKGRIIFVGINACVACKILHPNLLTTFHRSLHCTLTNFFNFSPFSPSHLLLLLLLHSQLQRNFWALAGTVVFPASRDGETVVFFCLFVNGVTAVSYYDVLVEMTFLPFLQSLSPYPLKCLYMCLTTTLHWSHWINTLIG